MTSAPNRISSRSNEIIVVIDVRYSIYRFPPFEQMLNSQYCFKDFVTEQKIIIYPLEWTIFILGLLPNLKVN